jgi:hypothetical protein
VAAIHPLRDSRGRDPFRHDGRACPCECTELNCIGERCPYNLPFPPPAKPAPRIPRTRFVPEHRVNPLIARAVGWLVWLLIVMGAISLAALQVPL